MAGNLIPLLLFQGWNTNGSFLAGGMLYSYAAGSTTPQATYTDTTLLTLNTNPIVLNALGQAEVALNPTLSYKFNLTDSFGNQMPGYPVDNVNGALNIASIGSNIIPSITNTYSLGNSTFQWSSIYGNTIYQNGTQVVSYPITTAEQTVLTAQSATVVNGTYPYGCVDRYVVNSTPGSGTVDMAIAFNIAFQVSQATGWPVSFGATEPYQFLTIVNMTTSGGPNENGSLVIYNGAPNVDKANMPIIVNHSLTAVFDCTGTTGMQFERVGVATGTSYTPNVCWLMARNATGGGSGFHRLRNCNVAGTFKNAVYYNYGSEDDALYGCDFTNQATTATTTVLQYTANNVGSLTSVVADGIYATNASTTDHTVIACQLNNQAGTNSSYCVYLDVCVFLRIKDCWMACFSSTNGGEAYIYVNQNNATSNNITLDNIMGEQNGTTVPAYGVLFSGTTQSHLYWSVKNCLLPNTSLAFSCSATLEYSYFENLNEQPSVAHGLAITTAVGCEFHTGALLVAITTSDNNLLVGNSDRWTITTRSNDYWVDLGSTNKSWTPALGTLAHTGALSYSYQKCQLWGNQCHVSFQVSAATSITGTAGQTITGLPFAAVGNNAVTFTVPTALTNVIPNGYTSGSNIICPTFSSIGTNTLLVDAVYFVA